MQIGRVGGQRRIGTHTPKKSAVGRLLHPVVRPDRNGALKLVQEFNDQLRLEGWQLVEEEKIAGRPRFVPQRALGDRLITSQPDAD
ncbi:hypothetical protein ACO2RV_15125 [Ancylobacter sp. VNQ12]|uniref:AbiJ-related protein n=1 Tax=Ancylobacter sp. VNQ12 TaxID=3400920 RepID=UPI003BFF2AD6